MFWETLATFVSTIGNIAEASSQSKAALFNQKIARFNANTTRQSGRIEEDRIRREARKRIGLIRANVGASGMSMEGSALDILSESVYNSEVDAQITRFNYQRQAQSQDMQADLYGMEAKDARNAGWMNAASTLLKGGAKIYGREQTYGTTPFKLGGG